jgi:hypothetical protein
MTQQYAKITDNPKLIRDTFSQAIVTTDNDALAAYKAKKRQSRQIQDMSEDINNIRDEMRELKSLLVQIVNKEA